MCEHGQDPARDRQAARRALLPAAEQEYADRLEHAGRRDQFIDGRALLRYALSHSAPIAPEDWRFARGERGKPFIAEPSLPQPLWFNLAHATGITVCAITRIGTRIGVDIEATTQAEAASRIGSEFFSAPEQAALAKLGRMRRAEEALRTWVLKESLAKAAEESLAETLGNVTFDTTGHATVRARFSGTPYGGSNNWSFGLYAYRPSHVVALAVAPPAAAQTSVCVRQIPLGSLARPPGG